MLKHWNISFEERTISIEELHEAGKGRYLEEAFGTGTAAVISPLGELNWRYEKLVIKNGRTGELSQRLYDALSGIQKGTMPDPFGWMVEVRVK